MTAVGLGRVKTKSDLVIASSVKQIFAFFYSRMTTDLKIIGAFIPRGVFTQAGSLARITAPQQQWPVHLDQQTSPASS